VLLDNLPELRDILPPAAAARERELREKIGEAGSGARQSGVEADLLKSQYELLYNEVKTRSPWYEGGRSAPILTVEQAVTQLLDDRTVLVEYKVCESKSFAWVLSRTGVHSSELPGRAKLTQLVNELSRAQKLQTVDADQAYWKAAGALSRELIAPVSNWLQADRILIVTDEILQQIPFPGLPWPGGAQHGRPAPLIQRFEVVNLPSASAAAATRSIKRPEGRFAKDIAVFADPVLDTDDERLSSVKTGARKPEAIHVRVRVTGEGAEALRRSVPLDRLSIFTGFNATLDRLRSAGLENYRVIHFGTAAKMDLELP
jgi:hypothetical protein